MCTKLNNFSKDKIKYISFLSISNIDEHKKILSLRNDERIRNYMFSDKIITLEEHLEFIEKLKNDDKRMYWAAYDRGILVGSIYLTEIDYRNKRAKLGIYTSPDLKGYGGRLMNTLKWIAFDFLKLNCLRLEVLENNFEAIRFYEKHHFVYEGKLRAFVLKGNDFIDVLIYSMLSCEYNKYGKKIDI